MDRDQKVHVTKLNKQHKLISYLYHIIVYFLFKQIPCKGQAIESYIYIN